MIQARIADCYEGYGVGGLNFETIYLSLDGLIPRAGCGYHEDRIVRPVMEELIRSGFPHQTYRILGRPSMCGVSIKEQCDRWLDIPGVTEAVCMFDVEPAISGNYSSMVTSDELQYGMEYVASQHPLRPSWYSNEAFIARLSYPYFLTQFDLLAAQYPWEPWKFRQYLDYETFLRDYAGRKPKWVERSIYRSCCIGWQFTSHGRTPAIGKRNSDGATKRDHDFYVSTIEKGDFMSRFWPGTLPPPPVPENFRVFFDHLVNVRTAPAGVDVGDVEGTVTIHPPTQYASYSGRVYEWGLIVDHPKHSGRWVAIDNGTRV